MQQFKVEELGDSNLTADATYESRHSGTAGENPLPLSRSNEGDPDNYTDRVITEKWKAKKQVRRKAGHRSWAAKSALVPGEHRGDIMSPEKRSQVMSRIKGKGTSPERIIFAELHRQGIAFSQHVKDLPGRPDIVFWEVKLAVFIDGDFWHGWRFPLWKHKLSQKWRDKIAATRERDRRNFCKLRRMGWKVIRIWEHQVESNPASRIALIAAVQEARLAELAKKNG